MDTWKKYQKTALTEMRKYITGESLNGISVSNEDSPESTGGMIARNANSHKDQWFIDQRYFDDNYKLAE